MRALLSGAPGLTISRPFRYCALLFLLAALPAFAEPSPDLAARIDAGWRVQRRWAAVTANGSFLYDFGVKTWNGAGKLKESFTRSARVYNRGETHRTEILAATRDGRDDTANARAQEEKDQEKQASAPRARRKEDLPSPFDPRFRDRYVLTSEPAPDGGAALAFRPAAPFEGALQGRALYDPEGRLRRLELTLAKRPRFTRRLDFTVTIGPDGFPERVDSSGEVSLVIWKRTFESTLVLRDVRTGEKETR